MTQQKRPWVQRCVTDAKLLERTGLDEFTLRRLRKVMHQRWTQTPHIEQDMLSRNGTMPRFSFLVAVMYERLNQAQWASVLHNLLDHAPEEVNQMSRGEYPIGPMVVRVMSALFGIKVDFLLLGTAPTPDRLGANIDPWPMAQTSRGGTT